MAEHPNQVVKTRDTLDNHLLKRYKVIIHNDDYTTFDFVTVIFMNIFGKSLEEAKALTMNVHKTGHGIAGYYIREVAESKVEEVHRAARVANFPLFASYEAC